MAIRSPYLGFGSGFDVIAIPKETDCHTSDIGHWFAMTLNWEGPPLDWFRNDRGGR